MIHFEVTVYIKMRFKLIFFKDWVYSVVPALSLCFQTPGSFPLIFMSVLGSVISRDSGHDKFSFPTLYSAPQSFPARMSHKPHHTWLCWVQSILQVGKYESSNSALFRDCFGCSEGLTFLCGFQDQLVNRKNEYSNRKADPPRDLCATVWTHWLGQVQIWNLQPDHFLLWGGKKKTRQGQVSSTNTMQKWKVILVAGRGGIRNWKRLKWHLF